MRTTLQRSSSCPYRNAGLPVSARVADLLGRMTLQIEPGTVEVKLGASAADCRLAGAFEVTGIPLRLPRRSVFFSTARTTLIGSRQDHPLTTAPAAACGTAETITAFVEIAARPPSATGMDPQN
jgi:hypothetical protein